MLMANEALKRAVAAKGLAEVQRLQQGLQLGMNLAGILGLGGKIKERSAQIADYCGLCCSVSSPVISVSRRESRGSEVLAVMEQLVIFGMSVSRGLWVGV
jgi:hypothetical protein